jgi:hypothetical protein
MFDKHIGLFIMFFSAIVNFATVAIHMNGVRA